MVEQRTVNPPTQVRFLYSPYLKKIAKFLNFFSDFLPKMTFLRQYIYRDFFGLYFIAGGIL